MCVRGKHLGHDVGDVVARGDELEADEIVIYLSSQTNHFDTKMTVVDRHHMVHDYLLIIVTHD